MRRFFVFIGGSGILSAMLAVAFVSTNSNLEQREVRKLITTRLEKFSNVSDFNDQVNYRENAWNNKSRHIQSSLLDKNRIIGAN